MVSLPKVACEAEQRRLVGLELDLALGKGRMLLSKRKETAIVVKHRTHVHLLYRDGTLQMVARHGQPRLAGAEAAIGHRRPRPSACGSRLGP